MDILIRKENKDDYKEIYELVKKAFENMIHADGDEQNLVNRLRNCDAYIPDLSLVALIDDKIVGHIMFTKANIENNVGLILAPLAVLPEYQKRGVGTALINEGHRIARELGYTYSIVVGHENYYPKFGYEKASKYGIVPSFEVPDDNFMVAEIIGGGLSNVKGKFELIKEFFEK